MIGAADTIFTYFVDKSSSTHYLIFVGDNETGKSTNLILIEFVGIVRSLALSYVYDTKTGRWHYICQKTCARSDTVPGFAGKESLYKGVYV